MSIKPLPQSNAIILENISNINLNSSLVYLGGSLAEGFGNETSDVDVYIVHDDLETVFNPKRKSIVIDGTRYDYQYYSWDWFNKTIDKLNKLNFKTEDYLERLTEKECDLLHRFKHGIPLLNEEMFNDTYGSVHFDNLAFYQVVRLSESYSNSVEDIQGAYESKDWGTAFFRVRSLLETVVTSFLSSKGETNPKSKWLYRKIKRYQEKTGDFLLLERYLHFQTFNYEEQNVNEYIRSCMQYCQEINLSAQIALKNKQLR